MSRHTHIATIALASLLGTAAVSAQPFAIDWYTIDGGGGTSAGGSFTLSGTIGQPDAGPTMTGGNFALTGGFWVAGPSGSSCPPCAADYDLDGGVTGADIAAFFADFEQGLPCADTDLDGGITGADIASFFAVFEAGGC
jgi:hypothetical protein